MRPRGESASLDSGVGGGSRERPLEGPRDGRELPANWVSALCQHEVGNAEKTLLGKTREGLTGNGLSARVAEIEPRERQRGGGPCALPSSAHWPAGSCCWP